MMSTKFETFRRSGVILSCIGTMLLSGCGGGSGGVPTYGVTASAGSGGSISPSSSTVDAGSTTQFTVTPQSGYAIASVTGCGGSLSGDTYTTGPINANCAVTASFVAQYTVTATAGSGGTISPSNATVDSGGTIQFTVTPKSGYVISGVTGCGGSLTNTTYATGGITADCAVTASFMAAWTWAGGAETVDATGVYGTENVAAASNAPGARLAANAWTDSSGNLWLLGGWGYGAAGTAADLNDLWTYSASSGQWTWIGGSSVTNQSGVYGAEGVAAAANMPGGRHGSATWRDGSGDLWLFGGWGVDAAGTQNDLNDLWEYSPGSREWVWVSGSDTASAPGVYGTQGVAAATDVPGARDSAVTWRDASGNLWLFGGQTGYSAPFGYFNDLWKYSPASGEWTWVGGADIENQKGTYGVQGVAAASNMPGARSGAASWTDISGNVWVFGGYGYDSAGVLGYLNDLWEYSPASGEWTWVGGSDLANQTGAYGAKGVAAASNMPGARSGAAEWMDASGNVWLFGGGDLDSSGASAFLSDLWEYSPSSGEWTWVEGPTVANSTGVYGTRGVAAASNMPGARGGGVSWTDANGNLWLFGGWGNGSAGAQSELNDLWNYPLQ